MNDSLKLLIHWETKKVTDLLNESLSHSLDSFKNVEASYQEKRLEVWDMEEKLFLKQ